MEPEEAVKHVSSDPNISKEESEFGIAFSKADDKAHFSSSISGMVSRAITHSDIDITRVRVFNGEEYSHTTLDEFSGEGDIVSVVGELPIETLKVRSSPRSQRSYANIISKQGDVNIE